MLGRPLLGWTLQAFANCPEIDCIVLIGSESDLPRLRELGTLYGGGKVREVVTGGAERQESVRRGLAACPPDALIAIHDAARPCITPETIRGVIAAAREHGAAIVAAPVADSLLRGEDTADSFPAETVPRDNLWAVQTPQIFPYETIAAAHAQAATAGVIATDDAALVRRFGTPVAIFPGTAENLKVTRAEDMRLAEAILSARKGGVGLPPLRIGHGYDVHPFAEPSENRTLYLGGVAFPDYPRGMQAHSDGDVLLHALCDALLGAAGMGDIGKLFPPSDMRHKDRRSIEFLREVASRLQEDGWVVGNVDVTVLAEAPKIGPKADTIRGLIAVELGIEPGQVGLKATTNEGLGFVGRGEGIAVHATALLLRSE